jgi:hypothetical protein
MTEPILPPLKPLPIKDHISVVYVEKGNLYGAVGSGAVGSGAVGSGFQDVKLS